MKTSKGNSSENSDNALGISIKQILKTLIAIPSVSPEDKGCQAFLIDWLEEKGFVCQRYDCHPVSNFFARIGSQAPLIMFAGHTDVVPAGDKAQWTTPPFQLTEKDGKLYGRGVADMKGSLAAMLAMTQRFLENHPNFAGSLGFLITSGEEGDQFDLGTPYVMKKLQETGICPQFCIVGEPSSSKKVGDVIKIGRRGSLTGKVYLEGKQGHVAYPQLADNPIHRIAPILAELTEKKWDKGNNYFPPTSLQITSIEADGGAGNIIPGHLTLQFNFRFSTEQTTERLKKAVFCCFDQHGLKPQIDWLLNGEPFLTAKGHLLESCQTAIEEVIGQPPVLSTDGGTSDGRFIAPYGVEVIELGPCNATIHQVNECVDVNELEKLAKIYQRICEKLFKL
ncbi:MAG: succinyl-diaminopimelate desuccinylase [Legionella sp.]|nr:succinyl-diaminopimelate desuccinylase [Legionella sp.]